MLVDSADVLIIVFKVRQRLRKPLKIRSVTKPLNKLHSRDLLHKRLGSNRRQAVKRVVRGRDNCRTLVHSSLYEGGRDHVRVRKQWLFFCAMEIDFCKKRTKDS